MAMNELIKNKVWQFSFAIFGSCVYFVKLDNKNIIIDTSTKFNKHSLVRYLSELKINPDEIDLVILTHNHFDHVGNIGLFQNAKIYANKLDFKEEEIQDINKLKVKGFKIIDTPGHTKGSFCILMPAEKVLFSGDTLFHNGIGRTDLPGSEPDKMEPSLNKLEKLDYQILCPGHI